MHQGSFTDEPCSAAGSSNSFSENRTSSRISTEAAEMLDEIRVEMKRSPEGARAAALRLVSILTPRAAAESAGSRGGLAPWQKRKVDCYLREHLERPLRVKQLAQQAPLSVSHFCRAFKESFGTTPHTHIIRLRLERAQKLMSTTRDSLSDIALKCGLADQAHLSKLFRRWVGETPNAWRRQNFTGAQIDGRSRRSTESQEVGPRLAA
jgi:AraC family transcriptional regulator